MAISNWALRPIPLPRPVILAGGLLGASLMGLLGGYWWVFDLASHWPLHYALGLVLVGLYLWLSDWRRLALLCLLIALLQGTHALYGSSDSHPLLIGGNRVQLFLLNLQRSNQAHGEVIAAIQANNPDLLVLLEVNQRWASALEVLHEDYPHHLVESAEDNFGIALYSRYPLETLELHQHGPWRIPSILAQLRLPDQSLTVYASHPPPPMNRMMNATLNTQLRIIADELAAIPGHRVLLGDLNTTPWSVNFKPLRAAGLKNTIPAFRWQGSWPAWLWGWGIPIDHILVTEGIDVEQRHLGAAVGSDHLPVLATLQLPEP